MGYSYIYPYLKGIDIFPLSKVVSNMKIRDLKPRQAVDELTFKVIEKGDERVTPGGNRVVEAVVGDETGIVKFTLWNTEISLVEEGKTYTLRNGYVTLYRGSMRLTIGRNGELQGSEIDIELIGRDNDMSMKRFEDFQRRPGYRGSRRFRR